MSYCFACFSTDRKLSTLDPYIDVCAKLFVGILKNLHQLWVCWECKAKLRSIKLFQNQVEQAEKLQNLIYCVAKNPLSRLTVCKQRTISIEGNIADKYKNEDPKINNEPKIKTELENLKEEALSDQEITYDDCIDDLPLEHLFQNEIKKEKTKQKNKKASSSKTLWDKKKPLQVKITPNEMKEWLEIEKKSRYLEHFVYKCMDCAMGYALKNSWVKHMSQRHNEKNPHICELCHRTFISERKLQIHIMNHNYMYKCRDCDFNSIIRGHMHWHLQQEHPNKKKCVGCEYCIVKFKSNKQLLRHLSNFHNDFTCDDCGFKCTTKSRIYKHITSNHGPRYCDVCKKTFKNSRSLRAHIKTLHTVQHDESSYCVQCDIQFDNSILFKRHVNSSVKHKVEVRGDEPKKTYPCSVCGKVYMQRYGMRNHYRLVHLKSTKYYCEECDLYLLNRTTYLRHHNKHRGIQLVKNKFCDICGRGFHTNRILINHIRTHTGERPHECPHCDAKFAQQTAMKSHVKHIHLKVERRRQFLA